MEAIFKLKILIYFMGKRMPKNVKLDIYKNKVTTFIGPSGCVNQLAPLFKSHE